MLEEMAADIAYAGVVAWADRALEPTEMTMVRCALVCGAGGFIGGHLVNRLKRDGFWVRRVDLKCHEFSETGADDFVVGAATLSRQPVSCLLQWGRLSCAER